MEQLVRLKVGPSINQDGAENEIRGSKDASLITLDGHARYQEAVYRGNVYSACNQAGQVLTALATAMTGFVLYNPVNSYKNLVLWNVDVADTVILATASIFTIALAASPGGTLVGVPTSTTALTIRNNLIGNAAASVALALSTATTAGVTPTFVKPLKSLSLGTAAAQAYDAISTIEIAGQIVVAPGAFVCLSQTPTTQLATGVFGMTWEEIPI